MAEYISLDAALSEIMGEPTDAHYPSWYAEKLKKLPAADVRPVVRGRWISHDFVDMGKGRYTGSVECSACGRFLPLKENFCPNCGADMREANDEKA